MGKTLKVGDSITIYFGDSIRKLLKKGLRKKNTYFVDYIIIAVNGDILTVVPNSIPKDDMIPYDFSGIRISKNDRHILLENELESLRGLRKDELIIYADEREYNHKEFKEALKPFRRDKKEK